jgi:hypothetical protein
MSVLRSNCHWKAANYNVCSSFPAVIRSSNWHSVLPEDGTLVPKHDEDTPLTFYYDCAFSWCNKQCTLKKKSGMDNFKIHICFIKLPH